MAKVRYQNKQMQHVYETMLRLASDCTSELYWKGQPRRGASHRCAFWDGFDGLKRTPSAIPGTLSWACYQAGKTWARQVDLTNASHPG